MSAGIINEKKVVTPEFSTSENDEVFRTINTELQHDVLGGSIAPSSYDIYTGENMQACPEQSRCRNTLVAATREAHELLGVPYDATESPISGRALPPLPNLNRLDVTGQDYGVYLQRVRVLKEDVKDVVEGVLALGVEVSKYDERTGETLPEDSLKMLQRCWARQPQHTSWVINNLRTKTTLDTVATIRQEAQAELDEAGQISADARVAQAAPYKPAPFPDAEADKITDLSAAQGVAGETSVKMPGGEESEKAARDYVAEQQTKALGSFAANMGIPVTPELTEAFKEGGFDAVYRLYLKAEEEKVKVQTAELDRFKKVNEAQREVLDMASKEVTRILDVNDERYEKFEIMSKAINAAFSTGPNGEKNDMGITRTAKIIFGSDIAARVFEQHPDLFGSKEQALNEAVIDDGMVIDSIRHTKGESGYKPTNEEMSNRRAEMVAAARNPDKFTADYKNK